MKDDTYFHFPPLLFNLLVSRPIYVAIPRLPINVSSSVSTAPHSRLFLASPHSHFEPLNQTQIEPSTYCTPRSPVLNTSILFSPKHANISTLHLPNPLTATSFSISSSSLALTSIWALNSPESNFSASPEMYSALRCESPAVRSAGRSLERTCAGEGNDGCVSGKRAVNFARMDAAAAPET